MSPCFSLTSGNGGEISPFLFAKVASSPVNLAEKALLTLLLLFSGAPCIVAKLKAIESPSLRSQEIIL